MQHLNIVLSPPESSLLLLPEPVPDTSRSALALGYLDLYLWEMSGSTIGAPVMSDCESSPTTASFEDGDNLLSSSQSVKLDGSHDNVLP